MLNRKLLLAVLYFVWLHTSALNALTTIDLPVLTKDQVIADFRVEHLYSAPGGNIVGAKFLHIPTGTPVFILQVETAPQAFTWVDTPANSDQGIPHALEHLLVGKGAKGRYFTLLRDMTLSQSDAATSLDFNFYTIASSAGIDKFFELFHAMLDALYQPDFTDAEAETEFYHFGVVTDPNTKKATLIEKGAVYDEMQSLQGASTYYFELKKRVLGEHNPFGFYSSGVAEQMRTVTTADIRKFHNEHYRLGPATGFIFAFPPRESISDVLQRISREFQQFGQPASSLPQSSHGEPKYPIHPSDNKQPKIYPSAGASEADAGSILYSWKPTKAVSLARLKLLDLLSHGLAGKEGSLLYQAAIDSRTRTIETGATGVDAGLFLGNSPFFPVMTVEISGMPGNRISVDAIEQLRSFVLSKIKEVSQYPDHSEALIAFNDLVATYENSSRRSQSVWIKDSPGFGSRELKTDWKDQFQELEMDPSFVRSISEEAAWQVVDQELKTGKNIWRDVIEEFNLLDVPYSTATAPSPGFLNSIERQRQDRIKAKTKVLLAQYHTNDEQEALSRFSLQEQAQAAEIEKIEARVVHPKFVDHPPLTLDDEIRYRQLHIKDVPVIAAIFDRPPTIDIGLSFDIKSIPRRYYRYLPLLPQCLDSVGLKNAGHVVPYSELLSNIQKEIYAFSVGYEASAISDRVDLTIRASATNAQEFRAALNLIQRISQFNNLDISNVSRLRDIVARRISVDDLYKKEDGWVTNPAYSLRYENRPAYFAVHSQLTRAHWDERLKWLLHEPASPTEIDKLGDFAKGILPSAAVSRQQLSQMLDRADVKGLEKELVEYWRKNLSSFPEEELLDGLRQLASEVQQDLRTGPERAIQDLRALQALLLNRRALQINLTLSQASLDEIRPDLERFLEFIPVTVASQEGKTGRDDTPSGPVVAKLEKRYHRAMGQFPWYVGLINPDGITGNAAFYADFPDYTQLDRRSLVQVLASKLLSGNGPQSIYAKTIQTGAAYDDGIMSSPALKLLWYFANRTDDMPSLIGLVNSAAKQMPGLHDPLLIDDVFRQIFSTSRLMSTFSQRGKALAFDIRDGNDPEKIRRFSKAILMLRRDPRLLSEITRAGLPTIGAILVDERYKNLQSAGRSIFFFGGSEKVLADLENRLPMPKLLRIWPSDYWVN